MGLPTILVIDTQLYLCKILDKWLYNQYRVIDTQLEQLSAKARDNTSFDAVIIGALQSEESRLDVVRALKIALRDIPIIYAGPMSSQADIIEVFRAGADDVLTIPLQKEELISSLDRLVTRSSPGPVKTLLNRFRGWFSGTESPPIQEAEKAEKKGQESAVHSSEGEALTPPSISSGTPSLLMPLSHVSPLITPPEKKVITAPAIVTREKRKKESSTLNGFLLGPFQVMLNDVLLEDWPSKKGKSLLTYLLYHHKDKNLRDLLMEKFWPGRSTESARNSLNVALHGIRKQLHEIDAGQEHILFKDESYIINPELEIQLDHECFLQHWRKAKMIERERGMQYAIAEYETALTLYRGDFLEDNLYDQWWNPKREHIKEVFLFILERMSDYYTTTVQYTKAISYCKRILEKDDCREEIHRRLMINYNNAGLLGNAIKQFHLCTKILREEFDVLPSHATIKLYEQIKNKDLPSGPKLSAN